RSTTWKSCSRSHSGSPCSTRGGSSPTAFRTRSGATPRCVACTWARHTSAMAERASLAVEDVYTSYGLSQGLFGVSLTVMPGECVCLLGRNGVGKTTTMRSIMGLTPPHRGRVEWKGRDITGRAPYEVARAGIGFVPEDRRIFSDLTVWENLDVASRRRANGGWTVERGF